MGRGEGVAAKGLRRRVAVKGCGEGLRRRVAAKGLRRRSCGEGVGLKPSPSVTVTSGLI